MAKYHLYILSCADGTLYTGVTTDLDRRVKEHNRAGRGAKYTAGRRPVRLVFSKIIRDRSAALREECRVKGMTRSQKMELIKSSDRYALR